jgi:two-component system sensor histidine kinase RpfC
MAALLLVDDELAILRSVSRLLAKVGLTVQGTATREEALDLARTGTFDAVICDCHMPGMSAVAFLDRLAADRPDLASHVVFTSGDVDTDEVRHLARRSGHAALAKPFDATALIDAIRTSSATAAPGHA